MVYSLHKKWSFPLTLFRMRGATSFSPVTSTDIRISPKTFWLLVYTFCHTGVIFQGYTSCQCQVIELEQRPPFKKSVFSGLSYDNFSLINARATKLWPYDHIYNLICVTWQNFVGDVMNRNYDIITFFSKHLYFKKA